MIIITVTIQDVNLIVTHIAVKILRRDGKKFKAPDKSRC